MSSLAVDGAVRENFLTRGFTRTAAFLPPHRCRELAAMAAEHYARLDDDDRAARRSPGSLISFWEDPRFADVIAWTTPRELIGNVLGEPSFSNGYVVSKPARSPPTFWHQDWWGWNDAASYHPLPHQVGALVYLVDTSCENGCLRVVPGSHRRRHPLHRGLDEDQVRELRRCQDPTAPGHGIARGEQDVIARAGELILIDARVLHAAHANQTARARPAMLIWYAVDLHLWSDALRTRLPNVRVPSTWPEETRARLSPLLTGVGGVDQRAPLLYGLNPDERLT